MCILGILEKLKVSIIKGFIEFSVSLVSMEKPQGYGQGYGSKSIILRFIYVSYPWYPYFLYRDI
jgi:hypothetical protein